MPNAAASNSEETMTAVVTAHRLHVRAAPDVRASILATLDRDTEVEVVDRPGDARWARIVRARKTGWVASKYLSEPESALLAGAHYPWFAIATHELGQKEVAGDGANPRITEYLRTTTLDDRSAAADETPWCSAFANWCVEASGYAGTGSALASSWLHWGKKLSRARRGALTVLTRPQGNHVGFYVRTYDNGDLELLGGNQGNAVSLARYERHRLLEFRGPA